MVLCDRDIRAAIDPGMLIGQVSFRALRAPAERPCARDALHSKDRGRRGPTPSACFRNVSEPAKGGR